MKNSTERRSYFRINDVIGLSYSKLDTPEKSQPTRLDEIGLELTNVLAEIDSKFNQSINILWQENPTVAEALGLLNKKVSLVAAHDMQEHDQTTDSYEELMVSVSGCGIGFQSTEMLSAQTRLSILVVLKPSNISLNFTATVVACEKVPGDAGNPYWMRVSLDTDNPAAQEQLIQHIVQRQYAQKDRQQSGAGR